MYDYRSQRLETLSRETHTYNTVGNHHHPTQTIRKYTTSLERCNAETYTHNNGISLADYYNTAWKKW